MYRARRIIAHCLLAIFALYYANITLFYHAHIVNGTTIVHSHFHDKAHTQDGTHSAAELTLFSVLSDFQSAAVSAFFIVAALLFVVALVLTLLRQGALIESPAACHGLRAPPVLS